MAVKIMACKCGYVVEEALENALFKIKFTTFWKGSVILHNQ